jgi:predicted dehydrogenase
LTADTSAGTNRRDFLTTAATGVAAASTLLSLDPYVHAEGNEVIRVGLIGCGSKRGGRGRGAAVQCVHADPAVRLHALADLFPDHLEFSKESLKSGCGKQYDVTDDRCFTGFGAYEKLLALKEIDVVILAAPPGFRPQHLKAAVEAGKHIFAEKPVATDAPGARAILEACTEAEKRKLSVVSGLCWRYDAGMREVMKRVHDGDIGEILTLQCTYNTSTPWEVARQKGWSDTEWQIRNWPFFTYLSGDFNTEQHVHSLDKMAWAMKDEYPAKAVGMGGRQVRTDPLFGHIYDHFSVVYEWKNGVRCFASCRQQPNTAKDVSDRIWGTKGVCIIDANRSRFSTVTHDGKRWEYKPSGGEANMYQQEHNELIAGIKAGKPINNGRYMTNSTMMAVLGRMSAYTGQMLTWDQAIGSKENLWPATLDLHGERAVPEVARPGITKFV